MMIEWVLMVVAKVTVILVAASMTTWMLRRRAAAARHLIWSVSLLSVLWIPALESGPGVIPTGIVSAGFYDEFQRRRQGPLRCPKCGEEFHDET